MVYVMSDVVGSVVYCVRKNKNMVTRGVDPREVNPPSYEWATDSQEGRPTRDTWSLGRLPHTCGSSHERSPGSSAARALVVP